MLSDCWHPSNSSNLSSLSVVSSLKTDRTPCCCRWQWSSSDKPLMYGRTTVDLISSVPTAPKIWNHYVEEWNDVEDFLQHLNTQQPTIHFAMETENDNTIPFLDTLVIKDPEGCLTTSVCRNLCTLISTCLMTHTTLNQLNALLSSADTIDWKYHH